MKQFRRAVMLSLLCLVSVATSAFAQHMDENVWSLVGLGKLTGVVVEDPGVVGTKGLSRKDVRAEVEVILFREGLLWREPPDNSQYFHVQIGTVQQGTLYAFTVTLALNQTVKLVRQMPPRGPLGVFGETLMVPTWTTTVVGVASESDFGIIRGALRQCTQRFVKDYRSANPPTPPKSKPEKKN